MATPDETSPPGPTAQLSSWVSSLTLKDVPPSILTRAKYLILDGLACGLVGAHLPWSTKAAEAIFSMEPAGDTTVIGWPNQKLGPLSSALLNSTFIQGFELDDWHSAAPLHSNSILLPALLAAAEHLNSKGAQDVGGEEREIISGAEVLLATIIGYEVGPRVGLALYGTHILTTGWHSGAVFGPPASAAAVGKLIGLTPSEIENALGIACTQACGLMSAQFGSEVKRMQHGFAARNGLLAALLARGGYIGIKNVFEQKYGGYLQQFSAGNGKDPQYKTEEICKDLGVKWQIDGIRVKPYASMAGTHPTIDCVRNLQELYPDKLTPDAIKDIRKIKIVLGEAAFHHGGWKTTRPLTSTGAQMSNTFVAATQIIHGKVLPPQFRHDMLENEDVWRLVDVTECELTKDLSSPFGRQIVTIEFGDGIVISHTVDSARGVVPALSNEEIVGKWRQLTKDVIEVERAEKIEAMVLALEDCNMKILQELLAGSTKNPIA